MKCNYFYIVLFLALMGLFSCSESDDFNLNNPEDEQVLSLWPIHTGNQWIYAKDTIYDSIRIDTSYVYSQDSVFRTKNFKKLFLPNIFHSDTVTTLLFMSDSVVKVKIPAHTQIQNTTVKQFSEVNLPIVKTNQQLDSIFEGTIQFNYTEDLNNETVQVDYISTITQKDVMEAVGGRVFQNLTKIENTYTFQSQYIPQFFKLEVWYQPGIGPVKVIQNDTTSFIINTYQIIE